MVVFIWPNGKVKAVSSSTIRGISDEGRRPTKALIPHDSSEELMFEVMIALKPHTGGMSKYLLPVPEELLKAITCFDDYRRLKSKYPELFI